MQSVQNYLHSKYSTGAVICLEDSPECLHETIRFMNVNDVAKKFLEGDVVRTSVDGDVVRSSVEGKVVRYTDRMCEAFPICRYYFQYY